MNEQMSALFRLKGLHDLVGKSDVPEDLDRLDGALLGLLKHHRVAIQILTEAAQHPQEINDLEQPYDLNPLEIFLVFEEHLSLLMNNEHPEDCLAHQRIHSVLFQVLFRLHKPQWNISQMIASLHDDPVFIEHPEWLAELSDQRAHERKWHSREVCDGTVQLAYRDFKSLSGHFRLCEDAVSAFQTTDIEGREIFGLIALDGMSNRMFPHLQTLQSVENDNLGKWILNCALRYELQDCFESAISRCSGIEIPIAQCMFEEALQKAQKRAFTWINQLRGCLSFSPRHIALEQEFPDEFERLRNELEAVMGIFPAINHALQHYYVHMASPASNVLLTLLDPYRSQGVQLSIGNGRTLILPKDRAPSMNMSEHMYAASLGINLVDPNVESLMTTLHCEKFRYQKGDTIITTSDGMSSSTLQQLARATGQQEMSGLSALQHLTRLFQTSRGVSQALQGVFNDDRRAASRDDMCMAVFKES